MAVSSTIRHLLRTTVCLLLSSSLWANATEADLRSEAMAWAAGQLQLPTAAIRIMPLDGRAQIRPCTEGYRFAFPFERHETLRAFCSGNSWQLFLRLELQVEEAVVSLKTALPAGHVLTTEDLALDTRALAGAHILRNLEDAVGRALIKPLEADSVLSDSALGKTTEVLRLTADAAEGDALSEKLETVTIDAREAPGDALRPPVGQLTASTPMRKGSILRQRDAAALLPAWVTIRALPAGSRLSSTHIERRMMDQEQIPHDALLEPLGLEQFESSRQLRAGEVLRGSDLQPAKLIRKGQNVDVITARGGLIVSSQAVANQDGRAQQVIHLSHPESGRRLRGRVTGPGEVHLE